MPLYWGTQKIGEVHTENHEHIWVDINNIYPIGSVYISVTSSNPSELFGGTWERIQDTFLLAAGNTYTAGSTGGAANITLTTNQIPSHNHSIGAHSHGLNSHTHSIGAHAHGLNSHTHSIPALSGTAASNGAHTHGDPSGRKFMFTNGDVAVNGTGRQGVSTGGDWYYVYGQTSSTGIWEGSVTSSNGAHTHSVTTTANTSGGPSTTNTANNTAFTSGEASGNTADNVAFNSGFNGNGEAHENMPPYLAVYIWKRVA